MESGSGAGGTPPPPCCCWARRVPQTALPPLAVELPTGSVCVVGCVGGGGECVRTRSELLAPPAAAARRRRPPLDTPPAYPPCPPQRGWRCCPGGWGGRLGLPGWGQACEPPPAPPPPDRWSRSAPAAPSPPHFPDRVGVAAGVMGARNGRMGHHQGMGCDPARGPPARLGATACRPWWRGRGTPGGGRAVGGAWECATRLPASVPPFPPLRQSASPPPPVSLCQQGGSSLSHKLGDTGSQVGGTGRQAGRLHCGTRGLRSSVGGGGGGRRRGGAPPPHPSPLGAHAAHRVAHARHCGQVHGLEHPWEGGVPPAHARGGGLQPPKAPGSGGGHFYQPRRPTPRMQPPSSSLSLPSLLPVRNGSHHLCAKPAGEGGLVSHHQPPSLVDRGLHRPHIPGQQRAQVQHLA